MAEGAKRIEGADLEVSFQELLMKITEMIKNAHKSRFRLRIFRLTLKDYTSLVEDIKNLNEHLDQPSEAIEKLIKEKEAEDGIVCKSRKIGLWKSLVKYLSFNSRGKYSKMVRDVKETLKELREILKTMSKDNSEHEITCSPQKELREILKTTSKDNSEPEITCSPQKELREILKTMSKDNSEHEITCSPLQNTETVIGMEEPRLRLKMEVLKDGASTLELTGLPGSGKTTQSMIWEFVGGVSAITGLVCFALSSSYHMSFGKLGHVGYFVLLLVCLIICLLIVGAKRIRVSERVQAVMAALIFVVICVISVLHDKLVTRKLDALSIISYGSFALMSLSVSRKLELGFETGFSAFFLQLFAAQLYKIKVFLFAIALVFCFLIVILRYYSESGVQFGSSSPTLDAPPNECRIEIPGGEDINEEQNIQAIEPADVKS